RAHAHDPDTPAPEPRVPEPCSIPEDIARLGAERTEGEDAPSAVHDHRTPPRVPLERARVLDGPLVDDKVLRRRAQRELDPDAAHRAVRRDEGERGRDRGQYQEHRGHHDDRRGPARTWAEAPERGGPRAKRQ